MYDEEYHSGWYNRASRSSVTKELRGKQNNMDSDGEDRRTICMQAGMDRTRAKKHTQELDMDREADDWGEVRPKVT